MTVSMRDRIQTIKKGYAKKGYKKTVSPFIYVHTFKHSESLTYMLPYGLKNPPFSEYFPHNINTPVLLFRQLHTFIKISNTFIFLSLIKFDKSRH